MHLILTYTWCHLGICFSFLDTMTHIFQHHLPHRSAPPGTPVIVSWNHPFHVWGPHMHMSIFFFCLKFLVCPFVYSYVNYSGFVLLSGSLLLLFRDDRSSLFFEWICCVLGENKNIWRFLLGLNWIYRIILGALSSLSCQIVSYKGILHYYWSTFLGLCAFHLLLEMTCFLLICYYCWIILLCFMVVKYTYTKILKNI